MRRWCIWLRRGVCLIRWQVSSSTSSPSLPLQPTQHGRNIDLSPPQLWVFWVRYVSLFIGWISSLCRSYQCWKDHSAQKNHPIFLIFLHVRIRDGRSKDGRVFMEGRWEHHTKDEGCQIHQPPKCWWLLSKYFSCLYIDCEIHIFLGNQLFLVDTPGHEGLILIKFLLVFFIFLFCFIW